LSDDPVMLGPINILKLKFSPEGYQQSQRRSDLGPQPPAQGVRAGAETDWYRLSN
jgi:hypothetical protein